MPAREPLQERSRRTHKKVLKAVLKCLVKYGYAETSTQRIAEMAGVSKGALFQRFSSKNILIASAVNYYLDEFRKKFDKDIPADFESMSVRERITFFVEWFWIASRDPTIMSLRQVWSASMTNLELRQELAATSSVGELQEFQVFLPEFADHPKFVMLNQIVIAAIEDLAYRDFNAADQDFVRRQLNYLIDLTVRELSS